MMTFRHEKRNLLSRRAAAPSNRPSKHVVALMLLCMLLALPLLSSCRPTDFFTEVIISPFAENADENNAEKTILNSPDAQEESSELSALDWSDAATQSLEVQNLITFSDKPNTDYPTRHSVFSLTPRFPDVLSSDPVKLVFDDSAQSDEEAAPQQAQTNTAQDTPSQGSGVPGENPDENQGEAPSDDPEATDDAAEPSDESADDSNPDDNGSQESDNPNTDGTGTGDGNGDPSGGAGGSVNIYDPNNAFAVLQHADRIAATGQAAIMVQMLGGKGALCAMDVATFNGENESSFSYFSNVFADELTDDFANTALLWDNDGASSDDLVSIEALVAACGEGGVIVFDQDEASSSKRFTDEMTSALNNAGIQLVPVKFNTVQGILDAAERIGEILSESTECALSSKDMASSYIQTVNSIVSQAASSHGGTLAARDGSENGARLLTTYNNCPVSGTAANHVFTAIATDYVTGITYTNGSYALDTTNGLLFTRIGNNEDNKVSPLSFWAQAAGVWDRAADLTTNKADSYAMLWGIARGAYYNLDFFTGATQAKALAHCRFDLSLITEDSSRESQSDSNFGDGLGSAAFPYLIVSATDSLSAEQVRQSVVKQIESRGPITSYSALPWSGQAPALEDENGNLIIGYVGSTASNAGSAFLDQGVSIEQSVRANPAGLLGSWTEGSVECVLESVWLARIYSAAPQNSSYSPLCSLSESDLERTVENFYTTFYRLTDDQAADAYASVVTDRGL